MGRRDLAPAGALAAVLVLVACSGSPPADVDAPGPTATPATTLPTAADSGLPAGDGPDASPPAATIRVAAGVQLDGFDESIEVEIDRSDLAGVDPFGRFAACSGLSPTFGVYSVLVSSSDGPLQLLSILSVGRVSGPGIHDADVRVETGAGEEIVAVGTLTLDDGLRSGSYLAFDREGAAVSGTFSCDGAGELPVPLAPGADDGVLDTVEAFVLLRRGGHDRAVGLAVAGDAPGIEAACPGATGGSGEQLVRVDGGPGAVATFDLVGGSSPSLRLRVGGVVYEFGEVEVVADENGTAGSFAGAADAVTVDGAFSCS